MMTVTFYDRETGQWEGGFKIDPAHLRLHVLNAYCDFHGVDAVIDGDE